MRYVIAVFFQMRAVCKDAQTDFLQADYPKKFGLSGFTYIVSVKAMFVRCITPNFLTIGVVVSVPLSAHKANQVDSHVSWHVQL